MYFSHERLHDFVHRTRKEVIGLSRTGQAEACLGVTSQKHSEPDPGGKGTWVSTHGGSDDL